ncbi:MAG: DUF3800 domain-containing protein [Eubacteriales bacterium]|nr:DUF3800 domain-containing protein [Eubacteriales bacterium]
MQYNFYYDETEHSRKINYQTITANNYCDNFIAAIVGWSADCEQGVLEKYLAFETKYEARKRNGELKSQTMKSKDFRLGFASLNNHIIEFYEDLLSLFTDDIIIYFSVFSKMEYIVHQLFSDYHNSMFVDIDAMKYSIIKAINTYQPQRVLEAIYEGSVAFVDELRIFLKDRIAKNHVNIILKEHENAAFEEILVLLDDVEVPEALVWNYRPAFDGFSKLLTEMNISDLSLVIDREGDTSRTLVAAKEAGIINVSEEDSKSHVGIRMADMLAGIISKLMQSLGTSLNGNYKDGGVEKALLGTGWFGLHKRQFDLYNKLYRIICEQNNYWYKSYAGIYADNLIAFVALLQYMNQFENVDEMKSSALELHQEYYNSLVCRNLSEKYEMMRNKLPLDPVADDGKDYFLNQRGAKVYKDIEKQPMLPLHDGQNKYYVLSVGFSRFAVPVVTIEEDNTPVCYKLPGDYSEWAMTVVGMANLGENMFPAEVIFSLVEGKHYADIL